jgi:hypothetical protein
MEFDTMRSTLIAAIAAGGCVLAFQTSALAQAVSAYPQSWTGSADPSTGTGQRQAGYFDQFSRNSNRSHASARSADIHAPSHE